MCKELARLLDVDFRQSSPQSANLLYRKVEGLVEDERKLRRSQESMKLELEHYKKHNRIAPNVTSSLPLYRTTDDIIPAGTQSSSAVAEMEFLKSELRKSTEAMARAKKQYNDFKEAVAKSLKFGTRARRVDMGTILARVNSLMANAPTDPRFDHLLQNPSKLKDKTGGRHGKDAKDKLLEKVQKKLRAALETIESQDMWIAVLQAKIGETEMTGSLQAENIHLRDALSSMKHHLHHDHETSTHVPIL